MHETYESDRNGRKKVIVGTLLVLLAISGLSTIGTIAGKPVVPFSSAYAQECSHGISGLTGGGKTLQYYIDSTNSNEGIAAILDAITVWSDTPINLFFTQTQIESNAQVIFTVSSSSAHSIMWTDWSCNFYGYVNPPLTIHWNTYVQPTQCTGSGGSRFQDCVALYSHEIGHALGLAHDCDNFQLDLMVGGGSCNGLDNTFTGMPTWDEITGAANGLGYGMVSSQQVPHDFVSGNAFTAYYGGCHGCLPLQTTINSAGTNYQAGADQYNTATTLPVDFNGNGIEFMMGEVQISTYYRYGAGIYTAYGSLTDQSIRSQTIEIDNGGVYFVQSTTSGLNIILLANVVYLGTLVWEMLWLKGNAWSQDWVEVQVMALGSSVGDGHAYLCGGSGTYWYGLNGCGYPSAYAEFGSGEFPYTNSFYFGFGVWTDSSSNPASSATTNYFWNLMKPIGA